MNIEIFRRVEQKYLLSKEQYIKLMDRISSHVEKDKYYKSTICNVYFDTTNSDLIVTSLEKPLYKEKVRLRSYGVPTIDSTVFLEIKSKYKGIVGKRRVSFKLKDFYGYLNDNTYPDCNKQIMSEIDYVFKYYNLVPKLFLAYDRLSYYDKDNSNFRITFDRNIRSRDNNLNIENGDFGDLYFNNDECLMELKTLNALPLWFVSIMSELKIYPTSFSKYGSIYCKNLKEEIYV
ncbi:MAG TPA: polyphosphate polymerase domain-containing protein [Bacilli bacterium]|nr:polyphosphate polymerase domain-containing protein [Bacilli bacterium]HPZ24038.1 polyphosphate polymerase domain-containing protein [Bacilli bacterium]HQC83415.1 polyphosphate polymerase domain-containing protein [Bacilli bacterium]